MSNPGRIVWDKVGERFFETGLDRGVLFPMGSNSQYGAGVAWNGLTAVNESPSGAEANPQYADNIKYLNLMSAEDFGATVEALTYPPEFEACDGTAEVAPGVTIGQQARKVFGLSYRTAGENIAYGQRTPQQVVDGWMNSSGHRANILNASYTQIGVGYVAQGNYWTQMFIGS